MFKRLTNRLLDHAENIIAREALKTITPHLQDAVSGAMDAIINGPPTVRSTGGATSIHLTKIQCDFKDFHAADADSAITSFIYETLLIKYGKQEEYEKANVSSKIKLNMNTLEGNLSNVKVNAISISDYQKSLNSATILYRVSVGFDVNRCREEKLYEVEYTLQLRDEYGAQAFLSCQHCGAALEEESGECKYCGMKHLRDTTSSWVITDYKEI